jgi:hypothetical protein
MNEKILILCQIYSDLDKTMDNYEKSVESMKKFGYKILVVDSSSCNRLFNYQLCDYYFYDKENRLFNRKPFGEINYNYYTSSYKLTIPCQCDSPHELNILYQNIKSFTLAKTIGYKYILRLECDVELVDEDVENIKNKISECVSFDKKGILTSLDYNEEYHRGYTDLRVSFWDVDWYLEHFGNLKTQNDWEEFLKKNNLKDHGIEMVLGTYLYNLKDEFVIYDKIRSVYTRVFRYKETKRFHNSNIILDFFKTNRGGMILGCLNNELEVFPRVKLTQHTENNVLTNHLENPTYSLFWVGIDSTVTKVTLEVDDKIFEINKEDIFSIENKIEFT